MIAQCPWQHEKRSSCVWKIKMECFSVDHPEVRWQKTLQRPCSVTWLITRWPCVVPVPGCSWDSCFPTGRVSELAEPNCRGKKETLITRHTSDRYNLWWLEPFRAAVVHYKDSDLSGGAIGEMKPQVMRWRPAGAREEIWIWFLFSGTMGCCVRSGPITPRKGSGTWFSSWWISGCSCLGPWLIDPSCLCAWINIQ